MNVGTINSFGWNCFAQRVTRETEPAARTPAPSTCRSNVWRWRALRCAPYRRSADSALQSRDRRRRTNRRRFGRRRGPSPRRRPPACAACHHGRCCSSPAVVAAAAAAAPRCSGDCAACRAGCRAPRPGRERCALVPPPREAVPRLHHISNVSVADASETRASLRGRRNDKSDSMTSLCSRPSTSSRTAATVARGPPSSESSVLRLDPALRHTTRWLC